MARERVTTESGISAILDTSLTRSNLDVVIAIATGALVGFVSSDLLNVDILRKIKVKGGADSNDIDRLSEELRAALSAVNERDTLIKALRSEIANFTPEDGVHQEHVDEAKKTLEACSSTLSDVKTSLTAALSTVNEKNLRIEELEASVAKLEELTLRNKQLEQQLSEIARDDGITQQDVDAAVAEMVNSLKVALTGLTEATEKLAPEISDFRVTSVAPGTNFDATNVAPFIEEVAGALDRLRSRGVIISHLEALKVASEVSSLVDVVNRSPLANEDTRDLEVSGTVLEELEVYENAIVRISDAIDKYQANSYSSLSQLSEAMMTMIASKRMATVTKSDIYAAATGIIEDGSAIRISGFKFLDDGKVIYYDESGTTLTGAPLLAYAIIGFNRDKLVLQEPADLNLSELKGSAVVYEKPTNASVRLYSTSELIDAYICRADIRPEISVIAAISDAMTFEGLLDMNPGVSTPYAAVWSLRQWKTEFTLATPVSTVEVVTNLLAVLDKKWS